MKKLIQFIIFVLILNCGLVFQNSYAQWVQVWNSGVTQTTVYSLYAVGNNIFAGTGEGIWISTNDGLNWVQTGLGHKNVICFLSSGNNIYAGTDSNGVFLSTNNGSQWTQIGMNNFAILSLASSGNTIFAGTQNYGIYLTTNNGLNWTQSLTNVPTSVRAILVKGIYIFAGTYQWPDPGLIYLSTDNGTSWNNILTLSVNNNSVNALATIGNNVFAGTNNNVFITTNLGLNWTPTTLGDKFVNTLSSTGINLLAGTYAVVQDSGMYRSTDDGVSWLAINEGFNNVGGETALTFLITDNYVFTGTNQAIWRRVQSEIIVIGIKNISTEIPFHYSLSQNYPNPFNPTTKIRFDLKNEVGNEMSEIRFEIFDMTGRKIKTIIYERLIPGTYEVTFDGTNLSSGIYYYRLTAGNFSATRKMVLLK